MAYPRRSCGNRFLGDLWATFQLLVIRAFCLVGGFTKFRPNAGQCLKTSRGTRCGVGSPIESPQCYQPKRLRFGEGVLVSDSGFWGDLDPPPLHVHYIWLRQGQQRATRYQARHRRERARAPSPSLIRPQLLAATVMSAFAQSSVHAATQPTPMSIDSEKTIALARARASAKATGGGRAWRMRLHGRMSCPWPWGAERSRDETDE